MSIDARALSTWMDAEGLPPGELSELSPVGGGTQNIMLRFTRGGREYVLRRGPKHLRPTSNDSIRRESRVLTALAGTGVPIASVVASCPDESVLGAAFYLMDPVAGFNAAITLPESHTGAVTRHQMGLEAVTALARLGAIDPNAVGLTDLGRPDGFLERQVARWRSELDSYNALDGYPGPDLPHLDEVASWLDAELPATFRPGIMHGDYHLANLMYADDGPQIAAICDWEMCTVGDPLLDLGWLIATWPIEGSVVASQSVIGRMGGLPSTQELLTHYAARSDRDLSAMTWYTVLACYKLAIVLEGTHARVFAGKADKATGDFLHAVAAELFVNAHTMITASR